MDFGGRKQDSAIAVLAPHGTLLLTVSLLSIGTMIMRALLLRNTESQDYFAQNEIRA